ncbi:MAG: lamin tail domain-containing protein [Candidatus Woesearchaeota archaeon]
MKPTAFFFALFAMIFLIQIGSVGFAKIEIRQVLYDPISSENGGEAVQLHNPEDEDVDISGWALSTEASKYDARLPEGSVIPAGGYFLIADTGWSSAKDDPNWPEADYEESINLYNSNSGVALLKADGTVVDAVGWGELSQIKAGLWTGRPAKEVSEGKVLLRTKSTEDNAVDFVEADADFGTIPQNITKLELSMDIEGGILIEEIEISPDELDKPGVQIYPLAGGTKNLTIKVKVAASQTEIERLTLTAALANKTIALHMMAQQNETIALYEGTIPIEFTKKPSNYSITINSFIDLIQIGEATTSFEWMPLASFKIIGENKKIKISAAPGELKNMPNALEIINNGNVPIDIAASSTGFVMQGTNQTQKVAATNIRINSKGLANTPRTIPLAIAPGDVARLNLSINIPQKAKKGSYIGEIKLWTIPTK